MSQPHGTSNCMEHEQSAGSHHPGMKSTRRLEGKKILDETLIRHLAAEEASGESGPLHPPVSKTR